MLRSILPPPADRSQGHPRPFNAILGRSRMDLIADEVLEFGAGDHGPLRARLRIFTRTDQGIAAVVATDLHKWTATGIEGEPLANERCRIAATVIERFGLDLDSLVWI